MFFRSLGAAGLAVALAATAPASTSRPRPDRDRPGSTVMTRIEQESMTPQAALERLRAGNARFAAGQPAAHYFPAQVHATEHGQFPFASILSCIDSRTSSELIFDLDLGDVFNARVAGNVINDDLLGSLEYAHKVAGAKLLVVIGHSHCGAVKGAVDDVLLGHITGLVARIRPAAATVKTSGPRTSKNHAFVDDVARLHVIRTVQAIREQSPILRELHDQGTIDIIGGFYDLESGKVEFYRPLTGADPAAVPPAAVPPPAGGENHAAPGTAEPSAHGTPAPAADPHAAPAEAVPAPGHH